MVVPVDELFAVGRVGRLPAVCHFGPTTPADVNRVDPRVPGGVAIHHVGDPLAAGRVGRAAVIPIVVGDLELIPAAGVGSVDLVVVPVVGRIGYPAVFARKGSLRLL